MHTAARSPASCTVRAVTAATVALLPALLLVAPLAAPVSADTGPSVPARVDAPGSEVRLEPAVLRLVDDDRAGLTLTVGAAAQGDVTVSWRVTEAVVAGDGTVTSGATVDPTVAVTSLPSRVQPGEALTATVELRDVREPLLVVATVAGAGSPTGGTATGDVELATLLLTGPPPPAPTVTLDRTDDAVSGTVSVEAPLLLSTRLVAATTTELTERLVLPGAPLTLRGAPAAWPRPSALVVTDEVGRTTRARVDTRDAIVATAVTGVVATAAVVAVALTRRRRRADTGT